MFNPNMPRPIVTENKDLEAERKIKDAARQQQAREAVASLQRAADEASVIDDISRQKEKKGEDISFEKLLEDTEVSIGAIREEYKMIDAMGRTHGNFLSSIQKAEEMIATAEGYLKRGLSRLGERRDEANEKVAVSRVVTTLAELKQSIDFLKPADYKPEN